MSGKGVRQKRIEILKNRVRTLSLGTKLGWVSDPSHTILMQLQT